jgi:hypothetical protein
MMETSCIGFYGNYITSRRRRFHPAVSVSTAIISLAGDGASLFNVLLQITRQTDICINAEAKCLFLLQTLLTLKQVHAGSVFMADNYCRPNVFILFNNSSMIDDINIY